MSSGTFGRVIGRTAAAHQGLNAIYLPPGIAEGFPEAVVREANRVSGAGAPPFAVIVSESGPSTEDVPRVGRNQAIRYRQGDRLAVVTATSVDIASFEGVFREVIGPGFPATAVPGFDVDSLAKSAAALLVEASDGDPGLADIPAMHEALKACMTVSADLISEEREGAASWNRVWYALVDRALDGLHDIFRDAAETGSPESHAALLSRYAWAAFGLPRPLVSEKGLRSRTKELVQSLHDYWGSEEKISLLTKEMSVLGGSDAEALAACQSEGWDGLDDYIAREPSTLAGLQSFVTDRPDLLDAFANVTEPAFTGKNLGSSEATILDAQGCDVGLVAGADKPVYLVESEECAEGVQTEWITVAITPFGHVTEDSVRESGASVTAEGRMATVAESEAPYLHEDGRIHFDLRADVKPTQAIRRVVLTLNIPNDDPLLGHVQEQSIALHVIPPTEGGVVVGEWTSTRRTILRNLHFEGLPPKGGNSGEEQKYRIELKADSHYRIVVRSSASQPSTHLLRLSGTDRAGWWAGNLPPNHHAEIFIGDSEWSLDPGPRADAPQSLLLAAIAGVDVDLEDPEDEVLGTLRGRLETVLGSHGDDKDFLEGLGHMVLPTDVPVRVDAFRLDSPVLVPGDEGVSWSLSVEEGSPSSRWTAARDHFIRCWLACLELLEQGEGEEAGKTASWPSKRSTHRLAENPTALDALLDSYVDLVDASQDEPRLRKLASFYPFSASAWTLKTHNPTCDALLLSPWHPIRLAWLTNAEEALRSTPRAHALAGTIEGWRFPMVGPSVGKYGKMVALPIEAGAGDIFAAWSMMVPVGADPSALEAPRSIGGSTPPGSSASGLTGSASDAAMRDFRRVNQHLPSITIDLASSSRVQRLDELDSSVLRAIRLWARSDSSLRGVRVLDSLNRLGDIPRGTVTELLLDGVTSSLSWARYQPEKGSPAKSNLRLLQDSGVLLGAAPVEGRTNGVLGKMPLRRFEAPSPLTRGGLDLHPGIAAGRGAFPRALAAVESPDGRAPLITVAMQSAQLLDDDADWTISGQSYVSASLLANVLSRGTEQSSAPKMLWEWRPPFLAPDSGSPLNRRPYASVMRVGKQLVEGISDRVTVLGVDATDGAKTVLRTLGTQGIGLSSLLSMGGHHPAGALGFYLSIRMMDLAQPPEGWVQVVMPIDSCREFLDVLAPDSKAPETRRQADLLVIRANKEEVCLIPLEVKMYGLEGASPEGLPTPGPDFSEALDQLAATTALLTKVQAERERISMNGSEAEAALWDNALATLLESGLNLSRANGSRVAEATEAIRAVVSGEYRLTLGRPLITFYQHRDGAVDQYAQYKEGFTSSQDVNAAYAALVARPAMVWRAVLDDQASAPYEQLVATWAGLVDWAHQHSVAVSPALEAAVDDGSDPDGEIETSVVPERGALVDDDQLGGAPLHGHEVSEGPDGSENERRDDANVEVAVPTGTVATVSSDSDRAQADGRLVEEHRPVDSRGGRGTGASAAPVAQQRPRRALEEPADEHDAADAAVGDDGVRLRIGHLLDSVGRVEAEYWPSNTNTTQLNMGIVGDLGTGKTQLLKALLLSLRRSSRATQDVPVTGLVFDYKKDFQDDDFKEAVGATLWEPYRLPLNVLELYEPYTRQAAYKRASGFVSMLDRIYSGIGPVQRNRLIRVIMELFDEGEGKPPTLSRVLERYSEDTPTDSVNSILNSFVLPQIFSEEVDSAMTLDEAMEDTVLVLNLNSWGADHQMKNSLVVLFLDMFYEAMKRSTKQPFRTNADGVTLRQLQSYLLVDEASNIMAYDFPVLESLLKEGREFGVGTILSSQYLSHFKSKKTDFAETLSTWFIHKVPNVTPAELSALGIIGPDKAMAERIKTLGVHESLYKSDLSPARFIRETPYWQLLRED